MMKFLEKNKVHLTSLVFISGFILDNFTLTRVDFFYDNLILTGYLVIAFLAIVTLHISTKKHFGLSFKVFINRWFPLLVQFAFGGLFSGYIIFYSRSGSFFESWPFIIFLGFIIIGNELIKKRHLLEFQLAIFFIAVFSYSIFLVPVLLGKMGASVFLLSGFASFATFCFLLVILNHLSYIKAERIRFILIIIGILYLLFNLAYFTNIIPPIPLSPKEIGVYHSVTRLPDGSYSVAFEPDTRFLFFKEISKKFNRVSNEPVYVYSSVFAPINLSTKILHRWNYYDENKAQWIVSSLVDFPIFGGRDGGYRGYSVKENTFPGKWRVDVITEQGQLIERIKFKVVSTNIAPKLETGLR